MCHNLNSHQCSHNLWYHYLFTNRFGLSRGFKKPAGVIVLSLGVGAVSINDLIEMWRMQGDMSGVYVNVGVNIAYI
jgi:hypothetical protein